ncbi:hypothetical protein EV424DRAFT_1342798 [Suillus variegatus]|nr:hypothetical protein EV424DRAFT_1342798 [Suillus variegatus]
MIENGAFNEAAILTPAYSRVIDDILGEQDARLAAGTSLAVCIIRTTKLLEDVANRADLDEDVKKLAVLHLQKRIRQFALHLLPLDFVDIANRAVKNVEGSDNEEPRPIRPLRRKAAIIDRTRLASCRRCGRDGHQFRKCPDYVCCICDELGPDHLSIHCPRLDGRIVLQEFRDDEKFFEALVDWEHNHKTLADLELRNSRLLYTFHVTHSFTNDTDDGRPPMNTGFRLYEVGDFDRSSGVMLQQRYMSPLATAPSATSTAIDDTWAPPALGDRTQDRTPDRYRRELRKMPD